MYNCVLCIPEITPLYTSRPVDLKLLGCTKYEYKENNFHVVTLISLFLPFMSNINLVRVGFIIGNGSKRIKENTKFVIHKPCE